jgi:hypothetical protein
LTNASRHRERDQNNDGDRCKAEVKQKFVL